MDRLIWILVGFGIFYLLSKNGVDFNSFSLNDINHINTNTLILIVAVVIIILFLFSRGGGGGGRGGRRGGGRRGRGF